MNPQVAARIRELAANGRSRTAIGLELGVGYSTVVSVLGRPASYQEKVAADRLNGWTPDCMDAEDWTGWQRANDRVNSESAKAVRPCTDCPASFAAEMRAIDRCNGSPGWRPPADDHEEAEVGETITVSSVKVSAPCGSCSHTEVCAIKATLRGLDDGLEISMPKPDPALTLVTSVTVECAHYARAKNAGGVKGRKLDLSEEERKRRADQGRANLAARATPAVQG